MDAANFIFTTKCWWRFFFKCEKTLQQQVFRHQLNFCLFSSFVVRHIRHHKCAAKQRAVDHMPHQNMYVQKTLKPLNKWHSGLDASFFQRWLWKLLLSHLCWELHMRGVCRLAIRWSTEYWNNGFRQQPKFWFAICLFVVTREHVRVDRRIR